MKPLRLLPIFKEFQAAAVGVIPICGIKEITLSTSYFLTLENEAYEAETKPENRNPRRRIRQTFKFNGITYKREV